MTRQALRCRLTETPRLTWRYTRAICCTPGEMIGTFWTMTLIISSLFELVGEGHETLERFDNGFSAIMGPRTGRTVAFSWENGCIARAVRNIIVHGLSLDRRQRMNFNSRDRASIVSLGFIPASIGKGHEYVYDVTLVGEGQYIIHFSPSAFWPYVQQWFESRDPL